MAAPSKKIAVSYDSGSDELVFNTCEIIGIVQLQNPEDQEDEIQQVPCYMVCNNADGYFYVPELEYDFVTYLNPGDEVDLSTIKPRIEEIKKIYKEAQLEVVEVTTEGKVSTIKRTIRKLDDDKPPTKS